MKAFVLLVFVFAKALSASADVPTWEELSSRLFTNVPIVWQAQTDHLPKSFWVYKRDLPRIFPAEVITNSGWCPRFLRQR